MKHLSLTGATTHSDIWIERGLLQQTATRCMDRFSPSRVHIVTDSNVAPLYLQSLITQFSIPVSATVLPAGEQYKRLSSIERIYHDLIGANITRKDLIIALGGGVIGDMAGFAAATFLRGISLCQIPTTLLAQVDSSVGGKTGIDLEEGKNLVGAFYQPHLVLIDPNVLDTLPTSVRCDGMAEVIKYGYIADTHILDLVSQNKSELLEDLIYACVKIKCDIVCQDEHDTGLRMILNFGHTIGHAVEKLGGYTRFSHGQAVSIGMVAAMRLSYAMGAPNDLTIDLARLLEQNGLPTSLTDDRSAIFHALLSDKKNFGGIINFILVRIPGQAEIVPITADKLRPLILNL